jgi:hypothetical protein
MQFTDRFMLRLHVEAVWGVRWPPQGLDDVDLVRDDPQPSWALCAADVAEGRVHIWRHDVTSTDRAALRQKASEALAAQAMITPAPGVHSEVALALVVSPHDNAVVAHGIVRHLTERDRPLIEAFESGSSGYFLDPAKRPLIGVILAGQLVSVAHSSRRTPEACELGIATLPASRRKGYALAATVTWTRAVSVISSSSQL